MSGNYPYHKSCYKEHYHPKCDVCQHFVSVIITKKTKKHIGTFFFSCLFLFGCKKFIPLFHRFQQMLLALSNIGHILSGPKNIVHFTNMMGLLGAVAVSEWRYIETNSFTYKKYVFDFKLDARSD